MITELNEEWGGQVVCGYNYPKEANESMSASKPQQFRMPCLIDIYPEVYDAQDKLPDEQSCAERAVSAPQNVFTNLTASNLLLGFAYNILASDARLGEGLKCHAVAFNTKNLMSFNTRMNHVDLLQAKFDKAAFEKANQAAAQPTAPTPKAKGRPSLKMTAEGEIERIEEAVPSDAPF